MNYPVFLPLLKARLKKTKQNWEKRKSSLPRHMRKLKYGRIVYRLAGQGSFPGEVIGRKCSHFSKNER